MWWWFPFTLRVSLCSITKGIQTLLNVPSTNYHQTLFLTKRNEDVGRQWVILSWTWPKQCQCRSMCLWFNKMQIYLCCKIWWSIGELLANHSVHFLHPRLVYKVNPIFNAFSQGIRSLCELCNDSAKTTVTVQAS